MKKYLLWLGLSLFLGFASCSDNSVVNNSGSLSKDTTEHKKIPVYLGNRAMFVSYDPIAMSYKGQTSGYTFPLISWRLLGTDPAGIAFDVYKCESGKTEMKLNKVPITDATCYVDSSTLNATVSNTYRVTLAGSDSTVCSYTFTPAMAQTFYRKIKLNTNVPDPTLNYEANDVQVGDLDGDGQMEIVLKRQPYDGANQGGWHDGTTLLEAYKLDGTFMWQIDMGKNIRSGSHYTSFIVYDFDGDGKCEVALRTSEGTKFGDGKVITDSNGKVNDYRQKEDGVGWFSGKALPTLKGLVLDGPEYISICRGSDGAEIDRVDNIPRGGTGSNYDRAKYWQNYWGDDYGNRMDRFFIGVAYLDGIPQKGVRISNPSLIVSRGIYKNYQVWAYDFKNRKLVKRWMFNTLNYPAYCGSCSHCFRVADLNGDGKDEILYGSAAISHDGKGLWVSGNGHGDALHVGKFSQTHPGLQIVASYEEPDNYNIKGHGYGCQMLDAATGKLIFGHGKGSNVDVGRCLVADIDSKSPGCEYWSSLGTGIYSCETGDLVSTQLPTAKGGGNSYNNAIWWTGALTRQMLDDVMIQSYEPSKPWCERKGMSAWTRVLTLSYYGEGDDSRCASNNGSKANPCYYGDFLGDYREEVIMRSSDNKYLYLFSTNHPTTHRFVHLMEDHTYDMSQAMQNMGYNQPTNLGYYIGADMK
ncbi:MAG: hypothetical protein LKH12_06800 [Prevotella sp.]|jgi:rhamnogalacturonan endolyase|nr:MULTISPECIES: hypothetical protein [unclassified Prevotella]MCH3985922.1 hypothetical protein [Prevotella sp.]MCH4018780.1 hypothetical protein [Prevotella sp.]MCI1324572.1 hypothetical protein [Prevotella sp.]MCI1416211.1 hypothetical protein [Prevotella sp.]MCI1451471.1 hypothetical protein [Prevotella sp.]